MDSLYINRGSHYFYINKARGGGGQGSPTYTLSKTNPNDEKPGAL
jgi:hypothetical protein